MRNQPVIARENLPHSAQTEAVYAFIRDYVWQEGYAPSIREIAQGCRLGRTTVLYHLHRLVQWRLIRRSPGKARTIILVDSDNQVSGHRTQPEPTPDSESSVPELAALPLAPEGQG